MRDLGMIITREQAAQVWAGEKMRDRVIDVDLAEEFARVLYTWICNAKAADLQNEYYRGILSQCEASLGCFQEASFANIPGEVAALMKLKKEASGERLEGQA